jgi:ABC-type antimicrobial peptide transport system permease subunit
MRDAFRDLLARLRALPRVTHAGATSRTPFSGGTNGEVRAADDPARTEPLAEWRAVTPGLFGALGLTITSGRPFDDRAAASGARVAIVSERLARALFDGSAVGRAVLMDKRDPFEVIGVVSDLRDFGPTRPARPTIYVPHASEPGFASMTTMTVVVRTTGDPLALVPEIRRHLRELDADAAMQRVATLEALATRSFGTSRTTAATVVIALAGVALVLGAIGVFGVVAFGVQQRAREFGVRLALGDTPAGILRRVLGDGLRMTVAGTALGAMAAWFVGRFVESFSVPTMGPGRASTVAVALVILGAVTLAASAAPARRAAALSPTEALRE